MKKKQKKLSEGVIYSRTNYHLINGNTQKSKIANFNLKQSLSFSELCNAVDFLTNNLFPMIF